MDTIWIDRLLKNAADTYLRTVAAPKKTPVKISVPQKVSAKRRAPGKKKGGANWAGYVGIAGLLLVLLSPFYYGYVIKTFATTWRWIRDIGEDANYRSHKSFGIKIPTSYNIHGIDVSYAQGKIDWQKVRAMEDDGVRIRFAFVKATEGLLGVDPYFKRNWREAPKVGITCGAYHYLHPNKDGLWQARFFLQNAKIEVGDLPPVVDIEVLDKVTPQKMRRELTAFLKHVEKKVGVKPIIYSGLSFYTDYLSGHFDGYPLWIAHYYQVDLKVHKKSNWWFWQHSDIARVNGINHTVDLNAFKGDSSDFDKLLVR